MIIKKCIDSNWLNAKELYSYIPTWKRYHLSITKMRELLLQTRLKMPQAIEYKLCGDRLEICLHKDYIEKFCALANIAGDLNYPVKDEDWLCTSDICFYITKSHCAEIGKKLIELQSLMPNYIQYRLSKGCKILCLHKNAITEFCKLAGFRERQFVATNDTTWINLVTLSSYIVNGKRISSQILDNMKALLPIMPNFIQYKVINKKSVLCIHKDYVKDFCKLVDLQLNNYGQQQLLEINESNQLKQILNINQKER